MNTLVGNMDTCRVRLVLGRDYLSGRSRAYPTKDTVVGEVWLRPSKVLLCGLITVVHTRGDVHRILLAELRRGGG